MNVEDSRGLAARLGITALLVLVVGWGAGATTITTATHTHAARSLAQASPELFVSTIDGGSVLVYSTGSSPTLLQTITAGVPRPNGIWIDRHRVLYAVNVPGGSYQTSLPEYKPNANSPFRTITDGIVNVSEVAVDRKENVYVTGLNTANGDLFLEIYPKNASAPTETLTIPSIGLSGVAGLAFDSTGALLVGETTEEGTSGAIFRLSPGSQTFTNLGLRKAPGGAIALDPAGDLYVGGNAGIAIYPPNSKKPSRHFTVPLGVSALAIGADGELYVGSFESVLVYAPQANTPTTTIPIAGHVGGLALSP